MLHMPFQEIAGDQQCDGKRPKCSSCTALGFECSYVQSASSSNVIVGKEYLSDLESRLERVEARLFAAANGELHGDQIGSRPLLSPTNSSINAAPPQATASEEDEGGTGTEISDPRNITPPITFQFEHRSDEAEGATDGIGSISFADEEDSAFLGPSSNIAFMRHLGPALARISPAGRADTSHLQVSSMPSHLEGEMVRTSRRASPSTSSGPSRFSAATANGGRENAFTLPPDEEVRRLMNMYFSNTGILFPYIHEGTFRQKYEEMKRKGPSSVQKTWLSLLNVMLAFAISTSHGQESSFVNRQKDSDIFYRRSIALCKEQMFRASNLETVQLQLLTSQYLQGSHKSLQTWMVHGVAVKGALQLGLHCQNASAAFTPIEKEFRKRTWYGCILLDRTLSMTFGRPPSIPEEYIKIDLPAPEPPLTNTAGVVDHHSKAISLMFFKATISLYSILNQTITRCYDSNLGYSTGPVPITKTVHHVFALETQLQDWKSCLPADLHYHAPKSPPNTTTPASPLPTASSTTLIHTRAATVLILRFLNLRILVHRPILTTILDSVAANAAHHPPDLLLKQVGAYNLNCCLESALSIITIVRTTLRSAPQALGAWWFTLYYTFNAALVICAALIVRRSGSSSGEVVPGQGFAFACEDAEARDALDAAIEALAVLDRGNRMVDKCRNHLGGLVAVLNSVFVSKEPAVEAVSSLLSPPTGPGANGSANAFGDGTIPDLTNPFGPFGTSPAGVELGEFLTDMDTEILNMFFA
ncbi:Thiamine repressible genes regulatory protein thi1 [Lasiodiplodia hormozganensis]|uniref:Thiamine repressible genes regulatory protein thi1 n=1 Tax=Lasiodiplodia hormozganensis TaxID=869390 RepID=A0AA39XYT8_9PEZI|nr:Thiamine repressible genes regulatory protein thi1 [Lasiodiplodia hormozganensis]